MADYTGDAVFFGSEGALREPNAIRLVFEGMFAEFAKRGASFFRTQAFERKVVLQSSSNE